MPVSLLPQPIRAEASMNTRAKSSRPAVPPTDRPEAKSGLPASNPRQAQDLRWQRTVRFNWDKGGSKGGRK